jgi:hypothetical protein
MDNQTNTFTLLIIITVIILIIGFISRKPTITTTVNNSNKFNYKYLLFIPVLYGIYYYYFNDQNKFQSDLLDNTSILSDTFPNSSFN